YTGPVAYPWACSPRWWAAGSLPHALSSLLGLRADALAGTLHVIRPRLPMGLTEVTLEGVALRAARVDLRFRRREAGGAADVDARVRAGEVEVRVSDALPAPSASRGRPGRTVPPDAVVKAATRAQRVPLES